MDCDLPNPVTPRQCDEFCSKPQAALMMNSTNLMSTQPPILKIRNSPTASSSSSPVYYIANHFSPTAVYKPNGIEIIKALTKNKENVDPDEALVAPPATHLMAASPAHSLPIVEVSNLAGSNFIAAPEIFIFLRVVVKPFQPSAWVFGGSSPGPTPKWNIGQSTVIPVCQAQLPNPLSLEIRVSNSSILDSNDRHFGFATVPLRDMQQGRQFTFRTPIMQCSPTNSSILSYIKHGTSPSIELQVRLLEFATQRPSPVPVGQLFVSPKLVDPLTPKCPDGFKTSIPTANTEVKVLAPKRLASFGTIAVGTKSIIVLDNQPLSTVSSIWVEYSVTEDKAGLVAKTAIMGDGAPPDYQCVFQLGNKSINQFRLRPAMVEPTMSPINLLLMGSSVLHCKESATLKVSLNGIHRTDQSKSSAVSIGAGTIDLDVYVNPKTAKLDCNVQCVRNGKESAIVSLTLHQIAGELFWQWWLARKGYSEKRLETLASECGERQHLLAALESVHRNPIETLWLSEWVEIQRTSESERANILCSVPATSLLAIEPHDGMQSPEQQPPEPMDNPTHYIDEMAPIDLQTESVLAITIANASLKDPLESRLYHMTLTTDNMCHVTPSVSCPTSGIIEWMDTWCIPFPGDGAPLQPLKAEMQMDDGTSVGQLDIDINSGLECVSEEPENRYLLMSGGHLLVLRLQRTTYASFGAANAGPSPCYAALSPSGSLTRQSPICSNQQDEQNDGLMRGMPPPMLGIGGLPDAQDGEYNPDIDHFIGDDDEYGDEDPFALPEVTLEPPTPTFSPPEPSPKLGLKFLAKSMRFVDNVSVTCAEWDELVYRVGIVGLGAPCQRGERIEWNDGGVFYTWDDSVDVPFPLDLPDRIPRITIDVITTATMRTIGCSSLDLCCLQDVGEVEREIPLFAPRILATEESRKMYEQQIAFTKSILDNNAHVMDCFKGLQIQHPHRELILVGSLQVVAYAANPTSLDVIRMWCDMASARSALWGPQQGERAVLEEEEWLTRSAVFEQFAFGAVYTVMLEECCEWSNLMETFDDSYPSPCSQSSVPTESECVAPLKTSDHPTISIDLDLAQQLTIAPAMGDQVEPHELPAPVPARPFSPERPKPLSIPRLSPSIRDVEKLTSPVSVDRAAVISPQSKKIVNFVVRRLICEEQRARAAMAVEEDRARTKLEVSRMAGLDIYSAHLHGFLEIAWGLASYGEDIGEGEEMLASPQKQLQSPSMASPLTGSLNFSPRACADLDAPSRLQAVFSVGTTTSERTINIAPCPRARRMPKATNLIIPIKCLHLTARNLAIQRLHLRLRPIQSSNSPSLLSRATPTSALPSPKWTSPEGLRHADCEATIEIDLGNLCELVDSEHIIHVRLPSDGPTSETPSSIHLPLRLTPHKFGYPPAYTAANSQPLPVHHQAMASLLSSAVVAIREEETMAASPSVRASARAKDVCLHRLSLRLSNGGLAAELCSSPFGLPSHRSRASSINMPASPHSVAMTDMSVACVPTYRSATSRTSNEASLNQEATCSALPPPPFLTEDIAASNVARPIPIPSQHSLVDFSPSFFTSVVVAQQADHVDTSLHGLDRTTAPSCRSSSPLPSQRTTDAASNARVQQQQQQQMENPPIRSVSPAESIKRITPPPLQTQSPLKEDYGNRLTSPLFEDLQRDAHEAISIPRMVRPTLGLKLASKIDDPLNVTPLYVRSITTGGPAFEAGLKVGDSIISWNGIPIRSQEAFSTALNDTAVGVPITLVVSRRGRGILSIRIVTAGITSLEPVPRSVATIPAAGAAPETMIQSPGKKPSSHPPATQQRRQPLAFGSPVKDSQRTLSPARAVSVTKRLQSPPSKATASGHPTPRTLVPFKF